MAVNLLNPQDLKDYVGSKAYDNVTVDLTGNNFKDLSFIKENQREIICAMITEFIKSLIT